MGTPRRGTPRGYAPYTLILPRNSLRLPVIPGTPSIPAGSSSVSARTPKRRRSVSSPPFRPTRVVTGISAARGRLAVRNGVENPGAIGYTEAARSRGAAAGARFRRAGLNRYEVIARGRFRGGYPERLAVLGRSGIGPSDQSRLLSAASRLPRDCSPDPDRLRDAPLAAGVSEPLVG